ncbi:MAG TPA: DUF5011 domain-containing protein [Bacteroidales bacterium]|nr:DUF5011 domain-containing protein [Bacteroidales bacterium]
MKKFTLLLALTILLFSGSCKKNDTTVPVITLQGANPHVVILGSASAYADAGAVATDDTDGSLTITSSGTVNMKSAGEYTLTYSCADAAGNTASATRKVIVDAAPFLSGNYQIVNYIGAEVDTTYIDTISFTDTTNNIILFTKFAGIENASVYATLNDTVILVPTQTKFCGAIPENKTFYGSGTFSSDSIIIINYFISNGIIDYSGHGIYTRN